MYCPLKDFMTFFEPCWYFWSSQTYLVVDEKVPKTAGFFFLSKAVGCHHPPFLIVNFIHWGRFFQREGQGSTKCEHGKA